MREVNERLMVYFYAIIFLFPFVRTPNVITEPTWAAWNNT